MSFLELSLHYSRFGAVRTRAVTRRCRSYLLRVSKCNRPAPSKALSETFRKRSDMNKAWFAWVIESDASSHSLAWMVRLDNSRTPSLFEVRSFATCFYELLLWCNGATCLIRRRKRVVTSNFHAICVNIRAVVTHWWCLMTVRGLSNSTHCMKVTNYHETSCVSYRMWPERHENTIVNGELRHGETVLTSPKNLKILF